MLLSGIQWNIRLKMGVYTKKIHVTSGTFHTIPQECCITFYTCTMPFTAPFNNMRTLKFEAQLTNGSFAAVNQVFGGSS